MWPTASSRSLIGIAKFLMAIDLFATEAHAYIHVWMCFCGNLI